MPSRCTAWLRHLGRQGRRRQGDESLGEELADKAMDILHVANMIYHRVKGCAGGHAWTMGFGREYNPEAYTRLSHLAKWEFQPQTLLAIEAVQRAKALGYRRQPYSEVILSPACPALSVVLCPLSLCPSLP